MKTLEEYLLLAGPGGHPRSGIILGVRMALVGLNELGIADASQAHDDLVVIVETDRCLPDAIELVTGCRLGNRRLKFKDMGKMAATFVSLPAGRAARVAARESANQRALAMFPDLEKEEAFGKAYRILSDDELFSRTAVRVSLAAEDLPGYHAERVSCSECGESIAFTKEIVQDGRVLCRACAGQGYFQPI